jgi:hypothetical protein
LQSFAKELVSHLKEYDFTELDFKLVKDELLKFLYKYHSPDAKEIFENLSANFFYSEPIHITRAQYKEVVKTIKKLEAKDINEYKKWALDAPCKIVISI